ncbi:hypothetical protein CHS0354_035386 [Potamilus streckersoni]|uniref:Uncharacterized protein n=1 Tax=Potamilus streckersoni TaxID=2493646 RepID=A0AAE0TEA1_9BIVA|nr:hypothetical protein CHS0354_035386 [Potamilus streckersoni]
MRYDPFPGISLLRSYESIRYTDHHTKQDMEDWMEILYRKKELKAISNSDAKGDRAAEIVTKEDQLEKARAAKEKQHEEDRLVVLETVVRVCCAYEGAQAGTCRRTIVKDHATGVYKASRARSKW